VVPLPFDLRTSSVVALSRFQYGFPFLPRVSEREKCIHLPRRSSISATPQRSSWRVTDAEGTNRMSPPLASNFTCSPKSPFTISTPATSKVSPDPGSVSLMILISVFLVSSRYYAADRVLRIAAACFRALLHALHCFTPLSGR
jgi:hypothetical protein